MAAAISKVGEAKSHKALQAILRISGFICSMLSVDGCRQMVLKSTSVE